MIDVAQKIVSMIDQECENETQTERHHLGASQIGEECERALWYSFRKVSVQNIPGRVRRLFQRGEDEEKKVVKWLRSVGCKIVNQQRQINPDQHFGGSIDGIVSGGPITLTGSGILEIKTYNDKRFKSLTKNKVKKNDPKYYAQCQVYMYYTELDWAMFFAVNKNDDSIYIEFIHKNRDFARMIKDKAERIINSVVPLERISDNPSWWQCKMCDHYSHCQLGNNDTKQKNCYNCLMAIPEVETWRCINGRGISSTKACEDYIPIEMK